MYSFADLCDFVRQATDPTEIARLINEYHSALDNDNDGYDDPEAILDRLIGEGVVAANPFARDRVARELSSPRRQSYPAALPGGVSSRPAGAAAISPKHVMPAPPMLARSGMRPPPAKVATSGVGKAGWGFQGAKGAAARSTQPYAADKSPMDAVGHAVLAQLFKQKAQGDLRAGERIQELERQECEWIKRTSKQPPARGGGGAVKSVTFMARGILGNGLGILATDQLEVRLNLTDDPLFSDALNLLLAKINIEATSSRVPLLDPMSVTVLGEARTGFANVFTAGESAYVNQTCAEVRPALTLPDPQPGHRPCRPCQHHRQPRCHGLHTAATLDRATRSSTAQTHIAISSPARFAPPPQSILEGMKDRQLYIYASSNANEMKLYVKDQFYGGQDPLRPGQAKRVANLPHHLGTGDGGGHRASSARSTNAAPRQRAPNRFNVFTASEQMKKSHPDPPERAQYYSDNRLDVRSPQHTHNRPPPPPLMLTKPCATVRTRPTGHDFSRCRRTGSWRWTGRMLSRATQINRPLRR